MRSKYLHFYRSSVLGYDSNLEGLEPPVTLFGYFQTWKYYQSLKNRGLVEEIGMKNPSNWFLETSRNLDKEAKVLGIHVRRGDYIGNLGIGTLSNCYYRSAIRTLREHNVSWDAIWIFSDDPVRVQSELQEIVAREPNVVFVDPPTESHSFESLLLLSKCSSIVIANSTFSWWAATLGNPQKVVLCPSKWLAQMDSPLDLLPESWIKVPSDWVNT